MRADARKNYDEILAVAREVIAEQGTDASLREVARRADVGLGTLYRHFPTREALLETLLRASLDELTRKATNPEAGRPTDRTLISWLHEAVAFVHRYRGVVAAMAAALEDPKSALHASCANLRSAGAGLLSKAQAEGKARADIDGEDLFALIGALGWIGDQPLFMPRADHLFHVIVDSVLTDASSRGIGSEDQTRS